MRRVLILLVVFTAAASLGMPQRAEAGRCEGTTNGVAWCCNDSELTYETGQPPSTGCNDGTYTGGSFSCSVSSSCSGRTGTTAASKDVKDCCFYAQGSCEAPYVSGQCPDIPGLPAAQHLGEACSALTQCSGQVETRPNVTATETSPIRWKPQIPLPGSDLFNGQEILITGSTLGEYIAALYVFVVSAIGILAALLIMYGGLKWLTAGGDRGRVQDAKDQISSAIIGILLAFGAYLLLLTISPKLVRFSSLIIQPVPKRMAEFEKELAFGARGAALGSASLSDPNAWLNDPANGVKTRYGSIIAPLATSQVPIDLIYAIIFVESGGRPSLTSNAGACGIMQVLPATAGKTCSELLNPEVGIAAGVAYLHKLASETCPPTAVRKDGSVAQCKPPDVLSTNCSNGNIDFMIPAYNGGQGANCGSVDCPGKTWWECEKNTGYQETRNYYVKVLDAQAKLKPFLP